MSRLVATMRRHLPGARSRVIERVFHHGYHAGWHEGAREACPGEGLCPYID